MSSVMTICAGTDCIGSAVVSESSNGHWRTPQIWHVSAPKGAGHVLRVDWAMGIASELSRRAHAYHVEQGWVVAPDPDGVSTSHAEFAALLTAALMRAGVEVTAISESAACCGTSPQELRRTLVEQGAPPDRCLVEHVAVSMLSVGRQQQLRKAEQLHAARAAIPGDIARLLGLGGPTR